MDEICRKFDKLFITLLGFSDKYVYSLVCVNDRFNKQ